jgi:hypothetical protein
MKAKALERAPETDRRLREGHRTDKPAKEQQRKENNSRA